MILAAITLGGVIVWPKVEPFFSRESDRLPREFRPAASEFLKTAVKNQFIPDTTQFILQEKQPGQPGDTYIANWNRDGQFFSFLVGLRADNKDINYQRIWIMPQAEPIDDLKATKYLQSIFTGEFLEQFDTISCKTTEALTECGDMKTDEEENLHGITVRSPVALPPPPGVPPMEFTIVSACFVPRAGTSAYTSSLCV